MAKNIQRHISHLKSSGGTQPSTSDIMYGEIAVNYLKDDETLYIKNSNDEIVKFPSNVPTLDASGHVESQYLEEEYPDLTAGNIVGEFEQEAEFTYRASAGAVDVKTGYKVDNGGQLQTVKGNAIAWNQLIDTPNNGTLKTHTTIGEWSVSNNGTTGTITDGIITLSGGPAENDDRDSWLRFDNNALYGLNHKYYITAKMRYNTKLSTSTVRVPSVYLGGYYIVQPVGGSVFTIGEWKLFKGIVNLPIAERGGSIRIYPANGGFSSTDTIDVKDVFIFDLTLIYGIGNEPTTVAQFEADYFKWFGKPLTYEPYDAGSIKDVRMTGLKTVGFNQWDEELEDGAYQIWDAINGSGEKVVAAGYKRFKNLLQVIPGATYYFKTPYTLRGGIYDSNGTYLHRKIDVATPKEVTIPSDCRYLGIYIDYQNVPYQKGDICINLSHSGSKNGEYEPYWESTLPFDVTKVYGKLDGEGEYVQVFPDGMRCARDAKDILDLKNGTAVINVESVDLGNNTWRGPLHGDGKAYYATNIPLIKQYTSQRIVPNLICIKYAVSNQYWVEKTPCIFRQTNTDTLLIADDNYTDLSSFTTSLSGVTMFYEIENPLNYTDIIYRDNGVDTPIQDMDTSYDVDDWGTEEVLSASGGISPVLDLKYGINASDAIRNLPTNYVMATMEQSLSDAEKARARKNIGAAKESDVLSITDYIEDNELVISAALNDLNDRIGDINSILETI